ncbi:UDP-glucose flavonoid 3-O-glucosyltransferase 7-like [Senna tora]|uniref:Glycosyltransferase n=1 Tax=Senna tora TaxID=362788 RepID=A0A834T1Z6_9FABA|nr:UDP-glucose flavonoid 3-O-glucosyltransferase 7-like [Senna tora]
MDAFSDIRRLKLYFLPYPEPGHMVPLYELAILFANRGLHVTIITTPLNILGKSIHTPQIHIKTFKFPSHQVGLPEGTENFVAVADAAGAAKLHTALHLLRQPIEEFILKNPPHCIIADFFFPWTTPLAQILHIPRLVFFPYSAFSACIMNSLAQLMKSTVPGPGSDPVTIPGLPHPITMTWSQLPNPAKLPKEIAKIGEAMREAELNSFGVVVNSFDDMDVEYTRHYESVIGRRLWPIGPTSLIHKTHEEKTERSYKSVVEEHECMNWLNAKKPDSVVYIAFGSAWRFPEAQLQEIARGMEASERDFIWVVSGKTEILLPKGLEERGMVVRGWAPQLLILGHPAIGGYVTHCGWNSVLESVSAGVPMMTWPLFFDQFYNEKLVTEVHGCGVRVGCEEYGMTAYEAKEKLVRREMIEEAVRKVMDGGDEALEMRRRVREMAQKARKAVEDDLLALIWIRSSIRAVRLFCEDPPSSSAALALTSSSLTRFLISVASSPPSITFLTAFSMRSPLTTFFLSWPAVRVHSSDPTSTPIPCTCVTNFSL